jgi:hypothetical protein
MSRAREPFTMLPDRFIDAERRGELSDRQAKLCRFIARRASESRREARLTLAQIVTGVLWELSEDTLLRELKGLRPEWIDFESKPGQRGAYVIRLTGLRVLREGDAELTSEPPTSARPPHDLRKRASQQPPHPEVAEAAESSLQSAEEPPQEPPHKFPDSPLTSLLCEGSEVKAASEGRKEDDVGKTTTAEPEPEIPELLDRLEPNPFHAGDRADLAERRKRGGRYLTPEEELERARRFDAMYPPRPKEGS